MICVRFTWEKFALIGFLFNFLLYIMLANLMDQNDALRWSWHLA